MGILLFLALIVMEVGFFIAAVRRQDRLQKQRIIGRIAVELIVVVLLATGILQGFARYGLLIIILAIQIIAWGIRMLRGKRKGKQNNYSRGRCVTTMLLSILTFAVALFPAFLFPQYQEPQITGEHQIEEYDFTWTDENRIETYDDSGENRKVTVHIWSPQEAGNYPLVLFDHGGTGIIASNTSTCKNLASNGYVVVSVGHPYQTLFLKDTAGKMTIANQDFLNQVMAGTSDSTYSTQGEKQVYENAVAWMKIRGGDDNFVLDTMLQKTAQGKAAPFDKINPEKIGAFGHSMGGAAAVLLGRERTDIAAVIDLEGTMLGEYTGFENGYEVYNDTPYPIPVLDVYSRAIYDEAKALTGVEYVNFYLGDQAADYQSVVIEDAGHLNFTDLPLVCPLAAKALGTGAVEPRKCIEKVNGIVLDYFNNYLK